MDNIRVLRDGDQRWLNIGNTRARPQTEYRRQPLFLVSDFQPGEVADQHTSAQIGQQLVDDITEVRTDNTREGWGQGDAVYACNALTGNCTDYHAYFIGLSSVEEHNRRGHPMYLLGETASRGPWYYFPVAFAVKTPLLVLLLMGVEGDSGSTLDSIGKIVLQLLVPFVAGQVARRWIGARSYKHDAKKKQTPDRAAARRAVRGSGAGASSISRNACSIA